MVLRENKSNTYAKCLVLYRFSTNLVQIKYTACTTLSYAAQASGFPFSLLYSVCIFVSKLPTKNGQFASAWLPKMTLLLSHLLHRSYFLHGLYFLHVDGNLFMPHMR